MGIVRKQAITNTLITYLGFGLGAINTLFLYTRYLDDTSYGLVMVVLSSAAILMPLMAFGVQNSFVKYYSKYENGGEEAGFLSFMVLLPMAMIIPLGLFTYWGRDFLVQFLSHRNEAVGGYLWHIFFIGIGMAYFEVFYAWAKVQLHSTFGNFMKELFVRLGVMVLLLLLHFNKIDFSSFMVALVVLYTLRMLIMKIYAYSIKFPRIQFKLPTDTAEIVWYSSLIILGGSAAVILLEIDKVMINQYIPLEQVAYYSVAIFMATVIIVPSRAMHQITYPLTASMLNQGDFTGLQQLYKKSSLTLFAVSGLVFLLVVLNLEDLYQLLPESYRGGGTVVLLVGLAKVYDSLMGNNNSILYNSNYYKMVLVLGIILAALTILFNIWLIPKFGINGAAMASLFAISLYNTAKLWFTHKQLGLFPWDRETLILGGVLLVVGASFYWIHFPFHPILNIIVKCGLMSLLFVFLVLRLNISEDLKDLLHVVLKKINPRD